LRFLCLLFLPLALFLPGKALADGGIVLDPEVAHSLTSSSINDRYLAIERLGRDASEDVATLLHALLHGNLFVDREQGTLYIQASAEGAFLDVESGATASIIDKALLRKVGVNNRQREALVTLLNIRALQNPDVAARRAASASLLASATANAPLARELLQTEQDPVTRDNYVRVLAMQVLQAPDANEEQIIAALRHLTSLYTPGAEQLIETFAHSQTPAIARAAKEAVRQTEATIQHLALFETIFFGLSLGSVLVLIAIGLAVTFGVMGVINMAYGEMVMLGAYTVWALQQLLPGQPGLAFVLAIPASFLVAGAVGAVTEFTVIRHLYGRPLETLLATFGVSLILQQAVRTLISPMNRAVVTPSFMSGMWAVTEHFTVAQGRVYIILFCFSLFALIFWVLKKTRLGLEVRAVTQNRAIARAMGINASRVDMMTFVLGSGVAGMAGVALSQLTNVGPNLGQSYIVDSFLVVVLGGVGNLWGTMVGGLVIGMASKFLEPINGAILAKIIIMVGIILFIQRHPSGLFPQKGRNAT
jgi:urea transport system permease protein